MLTKEQIESRLSFLEERITKASAKDLPALNNTYQKLMDMLVRLDMEDDD